MEKTSLGSYGSNCENYSVFITIINNDVKFRRKIAKGLSPCYTIIALYP